MHNCMHSAKLEKAFGQMKKRTSHKVRIMSHNLKPVARGVQAFKVELRVLSEFEFPQPAFNYSNNCS